MPKLILERVPFRTREVKERLKDFLPVDPGYTFEQAKAEGMRCILCPKPACAQACPVNNHIPDFIKHMREGDLPGAMEVLNQTQTVPIVCGRVCPQERQCEGACVVGKKGDPVAIGHLEWFVGEWALKNREGFPLVTAKPTGKRVAVVGAGPAGYTAARDLALAGHQVTLFEAFHEVGGVLAYGIPDFVLPKEVIKAQAPYLDALGVEVRLDSMVGQIVTIEELLTKGYSAVFLGAGAGVPYLLGIPGEGLNGVYSANELLIRVNLMEADTFPRADTPVKMGKKVAVIGGGDVAVDVARVAVRLGSQEVSILYRRSLAEMPARKEGVKEAEEEGTALRLLAAPVRLYDDGNGRVAAMECIEMELGEPDASGRRRPIPKPGSNFTLEVDTVIAAIGSRPHPVIAGTTPALKTARDGTVVVDEATGQTSLRGVWAGGDLVSGPATVVRAVAAAKRSARDLDAYLRA